MRFAGRASSLARSRRKDKNNNHRQCAMFKHPKIRQAGLIVFATTLLLILPNMNRLIG